MPSGTAYDRLMPRGGLVHGSFSAALINGPARSSNLQADEAMKASSA